MTTIVFDTHAFVKELADAGMPEKQAEVLARSQATLIDEKLATKQDLKELEACLRRDMKELEQKLQQEMRELEYRLTIKTGLMVVASTGVILGTIQYLLLPSP